MSLNIKDFVLSSRVGKIGQLAFSVYILIWGIVEPLGLTWIEEHKNIWRITLLVVATLVTLIISIRLSSPILEKLDPNTPDRLIQESYSSTGSPQVKIFQDGHLGNVMSIKGDYHKDEMDWVIKSSAQKANKLEFIFKHKAVFYFYLRVLMTSKNEEAYTTRWIRFDNSMTTPDIFRNDPEEMAIHYESEPLHSFNKAIIDIKAAVKNTYGQAGWIYSKSMIVRVRCDDGVIKSISLKK